MEQPLDYVNDYDPRQSAEEAMRELEYVIKHHPDVSEDIAYILGRAYNALRELT